MITSGLVVIDGLGHGEGEEGQLQPGVQVGVVVELGRVLTSSIHCGK